MASLCLFIVTAERSSPGPRGLLGEQDVNSNSPSVASPHPCSSAGPGLFWLPCLAYSDEILLY